jgi:hypothetical protein
VSREEIKMSIKKTIARYGSLAALVAAAYGCGGLDRPERPIDEYDADAIVDTYIAPDSESYDTGDADVDAETNDGDVIPDADSADADTLPEADVEQDSDVDVPEFPLLDECVAEKLAGNCTFVFQKNLWLNEALGLYESCMCYRDAGNVAYRLGRCEVAIELYELGGCWMEAAEIADELKQPKAEERFLRKAAGSWF